MSSGALDDTQPATPSDQPAGGARPSVAIPALISRFVIKQKLGEGGNGIVLLATDPLLGRDVAIKILRREDDAEGNERLLREARSVAGLAHDNVIVVHEVGTFEDRVYIAMEYVGGGTLMHWQSGRTWREIVDVYVRAGRALAAAHAAGLVHRDFKPDNVLVSADGRVRVTDFGLVSVAGTRAETAAEVAALGPAALTSSLTRTGAVMGTPRYMAPEQHDGELVDARADQFAFSIALYEALYGRPPFDGASYAELVANVLDGAVRPPPADSPVPAAVRDAILRGLARRREDRFASMDELLAALTPSVPRDARRGARARVVVIAAGALALVAAAAIAISVRGGPAHADPAYEPTATDEVIAGTLAYNSLAFHSAATHFAHAFALDPDLEHRGLNMLFDMAQAYRQAGDCVHAAAAFKRYLTLKSNLRPDIRARFESITKQLEECAEQMR